MTLSVDETAEIAPALKIIVNAKTQRPSTCNTVETLLVHCYGGQSRSRAVGAFAVEMLGGNSERYFETGSPNQYVYDVLETAWIRRQLGAF